VKFGERNFGSEHNTALNTRQETVFNCLSLLLHGKKRTQIKTQFKPDRLRAIPTD